MTRALLTLLLASSAAAAPARLKELVEVQGFRTNELLGYGLVVGLQGTGDTEQVVFATSGGEKVTDPNVQARVGKLITKLHQVERSQTVIAIPDGS